MTVPPYPSMPKLRADRLLVKQILMNLLSNDAMPTARDGHIEVRLAWRKDRSLAIQVKDDGPGIPKETLATINGGGRFGADPYVADKARPGFGRARVRRKTGSTAGMGRGGQKV